MKLRNKIIKSDFLTLFLRNLNSKCPQYIILSLLMVLILQVSCYVPQDLHDGSILETSIKNTMNRETKRNLVISSGYDSTDNKEIFFHSITDKKNAQLRKKRHVSYNSCPVNCFCASAVNVSCLKTSYEEIEPFLNNELTNLSLRQVLKTILNSTLLSRFASLEILQWTESNIRYLERDVFNKNSKLIQLDISINEIEEIGSSTFSNLFGLKSLNLSYNRLEDAPHGIFQDLNSLRYLSISGNRFQMLPFGMLAPLKQHLLTIDFSYNKIITVENDFFTFAPNVKTLLLNDNHIHKLPINTFGDLKRLDYLDLGNNNLNEVSRNAFQKLVSLSYLNLSGNKLVSLNSNFFKNLVNLRTLNLNSNPLKNITGKQLENCKELEILRLSNTSLIHLSDTDFYGLENLKSLEMNDNLNLTKLDRSIFDATPNLETLSLANCNLSHLSESLQNLRNLSTLILTPNPLMCDCQMLWFHSFVENYPRNLAANSLTCRRAGISIPTNLVQTLRSLNCQSPTLINKTETRKYELLRDAYLDCTFKGSPHPSITWVTPNLDVYHHNPDPSNPNIFSAHYPAHHNNMSKIIESGLKPRLEILDNGTLHISAVLRFDAGIYTCLASNPVSNVTAHVTLEIDPIFIYNIYINSLFFGALSAAGFLALTLFIQLLRYLFRK